MDGRRWAEEYIKRRNAAGSGVVIEAGTGTAGSSGGWNEVAKSRPAPQSPAPGVPESSASFRVVAGKKKGRRA
jgi:PERQ amino acid-rich with GYF domain-containing protein